MGDHPLQTGEPLDLLNFFPAVEDKQWQNLIPDDLSWQPIEGIAVQPYYRRGASQPSPILDHSGWLIRADVDLADTAAALDSGAEALGFVLPEPTPVPEDLPLGGIPLFFRGEGIDLAFIQTLRTKAESKGYEPAQIRGAVILPEPQSSRTNLQAATGTGLWTQCIDLETWHDQGATHVQEMACGLAQLSDLMAELAPDCSAEHIYFRVPVGERYLLDIARLRALRLCAREVLRAYSVQTQNIPVVGVPSRRYESVLDPDTHLVRQTLQHAAAILGGCNVVVSSGVGLSLQMQQILRREGRLDTIADAAAGSWMIEHLTDALGHAAWKLFQKIEAAGGLQKSTPWIEKEIQHADMQRKTAVYSGKEIVVGVNTYLSDQVEQAAPQTGSIAAPLEHIRLRAKAMGGRTRVVIHGACDHLWLQRLLDLCACTIHPEKADLTVMETPQGFLAQNAQDEAVHLSVGEPLHLAADRLLKLLENHAA